MNVDGQEGSKPAWKLFINNKPAETQDDEKVDEFVKEIADMQIDSIGQTLILEMSVRKILS